MRAFAKKLKNIYFLSFAIPVLLMLGIFIAREIFPFGSNSFMYSDMYHQYIPFLTEFWRKLHGGESLAFSWYTGLGSNFVAVYAYYLASPFNWLAFFCPENFLIEFMTYQIVLKIGLCGLTFSYYLSRRFATKDLRIVWFSVLYAMSGYIAAYNWNHMWMDCIFLAPLIILGLEELVVKGKCRLYCVTLTASIFTNYYLSILICIFLVLYFAMQLFTNGLSLKEKGRALLQFAVSSLLSGGVASVLLLPVMNAMSVTAFHDISFPKKIEFYFNLLEVLARHAAMLQTERGLEHWPNLYCGALVFVLVPIYFFHKRIPLKQKIGKLLLLGFLLLSFSLNILDFIWHGMNYPDSLPARQSFLYIFVLLTMCFEAVYRSAENNFVNCVIGGACGLLLLAACGLFVTTESLTVGVMACTWIFLVGYLLLALLFHRRTRKKFHNSRTLGWLALGGKGIVLILISMEAVLNMEHTSVTPVRREYYMSKKADYQALVAAVGEDNAFYRMESVDQMTKNDGTLARYPSASVFSSTLNGRIEKYYTSLGMGGNKVSYHYQGATPLTGALLGVRYTFSEREMSDEALYRQVAAQGDKILYQNQYTLPVGFSLPQELFHELSDTLTADVSNPIMVQNNFARKLFDNIPLFSALAYEEFSTEDNLITVQIESEGHLYGLVTKAPEGSLVWQRGEETREFEKVDRNCILDLGWYTAGEEFTIRAGEEENLQIKLYRMSEDALSEVIGALGRQPFEIQSYTADGLNGKITVQEGGYLVLSVPYEPCWEVLVDGKEAEYEAFAEAMLAIPLSKGTHTVSIRYLIKGTGTGLGISIVSLVLLLLFLWKTEKRDRKER